MNTKNSKELLLETAERLFAEKGFNGVGIREITSLANVNSSLVSYYFGGKEGLYQAVIVNRFKMMQQVLNAKTAAELQPEDIIKQYALTVMKIHSASPYFVKILYQEMLMPTGVLKGLKDDFFIPLRSIICGAIKKGIELGKFKKDLDIDKTILMLAGAVNFYFIAKPLHSNFLDEDENFSDDYVKNTVNLFLKAISEG